MRGRCMLSLIWLVGKYKKDQREDSNSADESLWSFIFKSDVR